MLNFRTKFVGKSFQCASISMKMLELCQRSMLINFITEHGDTDLQNMVLNFFNYIF